MRVRAGPLEKNEGLVFGEFEGLGFEGEGFGLSQDKLGGICVVWVWLRCVDLEVCSESFYYRII